MPSASMMRFVFFPIAIVLLRYLLLAGDCAAWTLLGTGVGVRALATNGETAAMTNAPVAADVHEPLDVHRDLGAQRALDAEILFDRLAKLVGVRVGEIANTLLGVHASRSENASRECASD